MTYKPLRLHCALQTSEVTLHNDLQIAVMESPVLFCKVNIHVPILRQINICFLGQGLEMSKDHIKHFVLTYLRNKDQQDAFFSLNLFQ